MSFKSILGLLETWIAPDELYGAIYVYIFVLKQVPICFNECCFVVKLQKCFEDQETRLSIGMWATVPLKLISTNLQLKIVPRNGSFKSYL